MIEVPSGMFLHSFQGKSCGPSYSSWVIGVWHCSSEKLVVYTPEELVVAIMLHPSSCFRHVFCG